MAKRTTICPPGGKSFIDVEDAAKGIVSALEWGTNGERYLISGDNLSFKSFFKHFNHVNRIIQLPRSLMLTMEFFGSLLRNIGIKTSVSLTNVKILCADCFYSNDKAKREIGFTHKSILEIINSNSYKK